MTAFKSGDPLTLNRLYGRASGHKLRKGQQELVERLLPQIEVAADGEVSSARLFGDDRPLHFEIGFGSGEHLADRADMLPDHGFIAAEPFLNGVATALAHIHDQNLRNIRIWRGDALEVLRGVRRREEPGFEHRRRQRDALLEHCVEERRVAPRLLVLRVGVVAHRVGPEREGEEASGARDDVRDAHRRQCRRPRTPPRPGSRSV